MKRLMFCQSMCVCVVLHHYVLVLIFCMARSKTMQFCDFTGYYSCCMSCSVDGPCPRPALPRPCQCECLFKMTKFIYVKKLTWKSWMNVVAGCCAYRSFLFSRFCIASSEDMDFVATVVTPSASPAIVTSRWLGGSQFLMPHQNES